MKVGLRLEDRDKDGGYEIVRHDEDLDDECEKCRSKPNKKKKTKSYFIIFSNKVNY